MLNLANVQRLLAVRVYMYTNACKCCQLENSCKPKDPNPNLRAVHAKGRTYLLYLECCQLCRVIVSTTGAVSGAGAGAVVGAVVSSILGLAVIACIVLLVHYLS